MKQDFFFLSPVLVVKVTNQNLEEVAAWCGGEIGETESRRKQGVMDRYVWVPTPKGNQVSWAFPGMFVTKRLVITMQGKLKATWAVFRRDYFEKNYFESPEAATAATWERESDETAVAKEPVTVNVSVGDAMHDALAEIRKIAAASGANVTINVVEQEDQGAPEIPTLGDEDVLTEIQTPGTEVIPKPVAAEDIPALFEHNHLLSERCDEAGCQADRYIDGEHFFTDKVVNTTGDEEVIRDRQVSK